jgi:hypothetical protein
MNVLKTLAVAAALAFATNNVAAESAVSAVSEADAKVERKEARLVCFAEKTTGSNLRKRICMTEAEREKRRKADKAALAETRRSTAGASASRGRD